MCSTPLTIPNPYYRIGSKGLNYIHNTADSHIRVPCGNCPQCVAMRQSFFLQRVQMESLRSYMYMFTLTYNDESLVYTDVGDYQIAFPVISDVQNMFKRLRRCGFSFRFTYVSEYGSRRHRPHFHGILSLDKSLGDYRTLESKFSKLLSSEWRRNYSDCTFSPDYRPLFTPNFHRGRCTTFDFHFIEPVRGHDNDVSFYVSKYITKYDSWIDSLIKKIKLDPSLDDDQVSDLVFLLRPRCNTSKDFGDYSDPLIKSYINKCASRDSLYRYPQYYDIYTGKQMPMSPYYGKRVIGYNHVYNRFLHSDLFDQLSQSFDDDSTFLDYRQAVDSSVRQFEEFDIKLKKLENRLEI